MSVQNRIHEASVELHKGADAVAYGIKRVARGTAAGFLGGLVASWMTNQYQAIESRPVKVRREEMRLKYAAAAAGQPSMEESVPAAAAADEKPAVKAAEAVSRQFFDHELTDCEKKVAGPIVQYGAGALAGALYGGLAELLPSVATGFGIPYATLLWLVGSRTAAPAMGLSKPLIDVTPAEHASDAATHMVFGVTLDISRRVLRHIV